MTPPARGGREAFCDGRSADGGVDEDAEEEPTACINNTRGAMGKVKGRRRRCDERRTTRRANDASVPHPLTYVHYPPSFSASEPPGRAGERSERRGSPNRSSAALSASLSRASDAAPVAPLPVTAVSSFPGIPRRFPLPTTNRVTDSPVASSLSTAHRRAIIVYDMFYVV